MTPELGSRLRRYKWLLLLIVGVVFFAIAGKSLYSHLNYREVVVVPPPEVIVAPKDEWLYVTDNSVLFFPVVNDECRAKYALMQVHKGTKVLVIARQGEWVEVEQNDQTALHTHGCIHESMLEKRDD